MKRPHPETHIILNHPGDCEGSKHRMFHLRIQKPLSLDMVFPGSKQAPYIHPIKRRVNRLALPLNSLPKASNSWAKHANGFLFNDGHMSRVICCIWIWMNKTWMRSWVCVFVVENCWDLKEKTSIKSCGTFQKRVKKLTIDRSQIH